jgi:hypothetical protein
MHPDKCYNCDDDEVVNKDRELPINTRIILSGDINY